MRAKLLAKQKGEWAEVCFAAEVLRRGWRISRPYGDSAPYDCIVDATSLTCHPERSARRRVEGPGFSRLTPPASCRLLHRVQIKSSCSCVKDRRSNHHSGISRENYKLQISNHRSHFKICIAKGSRKKRGYSSHETDFLAILIVPLSAWYIIPVAALGRQLSISLRPGIHPPSRFERFRDAWHLLASG